MVQEAFGLAGREALEGEADERLVRRMSRRKEAFAPEEGREKIIETLLGCRLHGAHSQGAGHLFIKRYERSCYSTSA
jgi:hypothetical protein